MIADGTAMTFKAPKQKASVVVFTDVTCGYCQNSAPKCLGSPPRGSLSITLPYPAVVPALN